MRNILFIVGLFASLFAKAGVINPLSSIYSDVVSATTTITTNSTSDVLMTGMTLTPPAGKYKVSTLTMITDSSSNNATVRTSVYCGGTQSGIYTLGTPQFTSGGGLGLGTSTIPLNTSNKAICTVNGVQAIELRWRTTAGTATSIGRILIIERLTP